MANPNGHVIPQLAMAGKEKLFHSSFCSMLTFNVQGPVVQN